MSKRDYVALAGMIRRRFAVDEAWRKDGKGDWAIRLYVGDLVDYLQTTNPRFDRERFLTACGF